MDNLKVISIRMSEEEIQAIDKALKPHPYYSRSNFIRAAVQVLLNANALGDSEIPIVDNRTVIYDALRLPFGSHTGIKVNLKIEHYDKRAQRNSE